MPRLLAINVALTNTKTPLASLECDSAIFQADKTNASVASLYNTTTTVKLCDLAAGESIQIFGFFTRNLSEIDVASVAASGDILYIIPFKT